MLTILLTIVLPFAVPQQVPSISHTFLQGTWASEWQDSNALFVIEGDSIAYLEDGLKNYPFILTDSTMTIIFDAYTEIVEVKALAANKMMWIDPIDKSQTILYRVKQ